MKSQLRVASVSERAADELSNTLLTTTQPTSAPDILFPPRHDLLVPLPQLLQEQARAPLQPAPRERSRRRYTASWENIKKTYNVTHGKWWLERTWYKGTLGGIELHTLIKIREGLQTFLKMREGRAELNVCGRGRSFVQRMFQGKPWFGELRNETSVAWTNYKRKILLPARCSVESISCSVGGSVGAAGSRGPRSRMSLYARTD